jgi:hypothetical protein
LGRRVTTLGAADASRGPGAVTIRAALPDALPAGWYRVEARMTASAGDGASHSRALFVR